MLGEKLLRHIDFQCAKEARPCLMREGGITTLLVEAFVCHASPTESPDFAGPRRPTAI